VGGVWIFSGMTQWAIMANKTIFLKSMRAGMRN
jgi:hypothetical protein